MIKKILEALDIRFKSDLTEVFPSMPLESLLHILNIKEINIYHSNYNKNRRHTLKLAVKKYLYEEDISSSRR